MDCIAAESGSSGYPTVRVPHVSRNPAVWPHDTSHFGDSLGWVRNEADHQCHGSGIELAVSKWQRLRIAPTELRKVALLTGCEHRRSGPRTDRVPAPLRAHNVPRSAR